MGSERWGDSARDRAMLDSWLTTEPEWSQDKMDMEDWGIDFLDEVEGELKSNHENDGLWTAWQSADYETVMDWIEDEYELTEEQIEWIKEALEVE